MATTVHEAVGNAIDALIRAEGVLQVRTLDNLDALVKEGKPVDLAQLDMMVKKPIMQTVSDLRRTRLSLLTATRQTEPKQVGGVTDGSTS